jgi:hypothetical protein
LNSPNSYSVSKYFEANIKKADQTILLDPFVPLIMATKYSQKNKEKTSLAAQHEEIEPMLEGLT